MYSRKLTFLYSLTARVEGLRRKKWLCAYLYRIHTQTSFNWFLNTSKQSNRCLWNFCLATNYSVSRDVKNSKRADTPVTEGTGTDSRVSNDSAAISVSHRKPNTHATALSNSTALNSTALNSTALNSTALSLTALEKSRLNSPLPPYGLSKYDSWVTSAGWSKVVTHSLTHSLTHSFIHSFIHSLTHQPTYSLI